MRDDAPPAPDVDAHVRLDLDANPIKAHRLETTFERPGGRRSTAPFTARLVATDDTVDYYLGAPETTLSELEATLRRLYPDGTKLDRADPPALPDDPTAALTLRGRGERRDDWQTSLDPVVTEAAFELDPDRINPQFPLAKAVEVLAPREATVHYQALIVPKPDWRHQATDRIRQLTRNRDTVAQRAFAFLSDDQAPIDADIDNADRSHRRRIHSIEDASAEHAFSVYARAVAVGPDAHAALDSLGTSLAAASGEFYYVDPKLHRDTETVATTAERIETYTPPDPPTRLQRLRRKLPVTSNAVPELVAGPLTIPNFCLFDGDSLTQRGRRAMGVTPDERTGIQRPDEETLTQYEAGLLLGYPLTDDDEPTDEPLALPPDLQPLHAAWFGKTGSGKSTALVNAILENHPATAGADILVDPKGDGMPTDYLRAHYAKYGDLDDVYYFDCTEALPAISFFDIRDQLEVGIDRKTAVEDVTDHYIALLTAIMGKERFEQAVRSPDIIRYLVKALFDPVHGADAFTHSELQDAFQRMRDTRDAPPASDPELQRMLDGVAANSKRSFDELMQGVANRIEKIPLHDRLGRLFNHVPEDDDNEADTADPRFDLREIIDEDAVVIIDTGGLRPESRRGITLVLLSQLWTALQRRTRTSGELKPPLVNLYLEEAASIAASGLVSDLLAKSRAFRLSMTLAMQFPGQLRRTDSEAYAELLNNVSTLVTGNVAVDPDLKKRLATEAMDTDEVANRLRALRRGQWFVSLPAEFGDAEPRPFLAASAPIPAGHPESDDPLSESRRAAFEAAFDVVRDRTRLEHGIDLTVNRRSGQHERTQSHENTADANTTNAETPSSEGASPPGSLLPHTERLPDVVSYDADRHALCCGACGSRHDPTREGMERAIECCHELAAVDRDDIPVCELSLKLSDAERQHSPYSDAQLRFLHAVYGAHQRRFDFELEYDLVRDSMRRLEEYVGIDRDAVDELLDQGLLSKDCQHPHLLYTVTPEGRTAAKIRHREGVAHGDGAGDLNESSLHVAMVELGRRYVQQAFVEDPDSAAVEVRAYHDLEDGRLDVAGLDANDEIVVVLEAERSNNDTRVAAPNDYDKMATHDPEAAIWVAKTREDAHAVLDALNDPADGETRVEKSYSESTAPQRFTIDTPGLTDIYTFTRLRTLVVE